MQGWSMQGWSMQGWSMQGFQLGSATFSGDDLEDLHVEKGELVATRNGQTLRGTQLIGTRLWADALDDEGSPTTVQYQIVGIEEEDETNYDPTGTGDTYLYTLEQWVPDTNSWVPGCPADQDGRRAAIPLAATWDESGARVTSSTRFTLSCTTGVVAKCYRWGYRPWLTGYGGANMSDMHWTCTRMARADYCGNGIPNTHDGTEINMWDTLPSPGPIQTRGGLLPPFPMRFEAGWNTGGAVCLSLSRWLLDDGIEIAQLCPTRLIPPGLLGATVCNTVAGVLLYDANAKLFNDSKLNIGL